MSAAVSEEAVESFVTTAAEDGVDGDGLAADEREEGFRIRTPAGAESGLSADELRDAARTHAAFVAEWYFWEQTAPTDPAARAFLRWIEGAAEQSVPTRRSRLADGVAETWGQLRIRVVLAADGIRRYDCRHVDDAGRDVADLAAHDDPATAQEIARYDADGAYRPLKTAPTLADGWVFPALDADALVRTVDHVYPATIANWHLERQGDLDVTHWRETATRQTGIYDVVDEVTGDQVAWLAEACCVDSQCLKRRAWDETAEESLDVPRGDGEFPCREPCSLVVAAAREIALAEREEPEQVELSLTPSEREQLGRVLDAVAAGETDEIRDGDLGDGANRLRARYLRAKLADEGQLPTGDGDH